MSTVLTPYLVTPGSAPRRFELAKSRKRRIREKKKRQRLVMEFCSDAGTKMISARYAKEVRLWRGLVIVEEPGGLVNEYQVRPDTPASLGDFIGALRNKVRDFADDNSVRFGLNVVA